MVKDCHFTREQYIFYKVNIKKKLTKEGLNIFNTTDAFVTLPWYKQSTLQTRTSLFQTYLPIGFFSQLCSGEQIEHRWFTVLIPGDENILPKFKRDPWLANAWHKNKLTLQSDAFAIAKAVHPHPLLLWASNSPGRWSHDSWGGKTMLVDYFLEPTLKF